MTRLYAVSGKVAATIYKIAGFILISVLTPKISHDIPCSPMDGCGRWGETRRHLSGAPCRASVGARWGKKWHVFVHLRERSTARGEFQCRRPFAPRLPP